MAVVRTDTDFYGRIRTVLAAKLQLAGIINIVVQAKACFKTKGAFFYFAKIEKCHEKVWKKGVEFEEGEKDLSSKGLFPLLKYRPLSGTEQKYKTIKIKYRRKNK